MTMTASLLAFALAATLLTIAPGLDTALVLRTAAVEGARRAAFAAAGICAGLLCWAAIVILGLGALLAASRLAYDILRWAGVAYLIWLGVGLLLRPRTVWTADDAPAASGHDRRWFLRGLLTNVLNPKVGVFYVTFLPQFVPHGVAVAPWIAMLAALHITEGAVWLALLILATRPIGKLLRRPAVVRALDRLTGLVLVGFGLRLATEARR